MNFGLFVVSELIINVNLQKKDGGRGRCLNLLNWINTVKVISLKLKMRLVEDYAERDRGRIAGNVRFLIEKAISVLEKPKMH